MRTCVSLLLVLAALVVGGAALPARGQSAATVYLPLLSSGSAPAYMLADLTPGPAETELYAGLMAARGDTLFFVKGCGELWKSESRTGSAVRLRLFEAEAISFCAHVGSLTTLGNSLFFVAYRSDAAAGLWLSDGTPAGTRELAPIAPPGSGANRLAVYGLTPLGGALYFVVAGIAAGSGGASQVVGTELWRSDGTPAGTGRVSELPTGTLSPLAFDGKLFFVRDAEAGRQELWVSDGSAAGPSLVASTGGIFGLGASAGRLWFASAGEQNYELWTSDGTTAGTRLVQAFDQVLGPSQFVELQGKTYFSLYVPFPRVFTELWVSDGSAAGTTRLFEGEVSGLITHNGALYFTSGQRLFRSDGTSAGTGQVSPAPVIPGALMSAGGLLYFGGYAEGGGAQLWASDGTAAGTRLLQQIGSGRTGGPDNFVRGSDTLYFTADDGAHGRELWALPLSR